MCLYSLNYCLCIGCCVHVRSFLSRTQTFEFWFSCFQHFFLHLWAMNATEHRFVPNPCWYCSRMLTFSFQIKLQRPQRQLGVTMYNELKLSWYSCFLFYHTFMYATHCFVPKVLNFRNLELYIGILHFLEITWPCKPIFHFVFLFNDSICLY